MIFGILVISTVVFTLLAPIVSLVRYYHWKKSAPIKNVFLILIGFITWPCVPIYYAFTNKDKILLAMFLLSLLLMLIFGVYWININLDKFIQFEHHLLKGYQIYQ